MTFEQEHLGHWLDAIERDQDGGKQQAQQDQARKRKMYKSKHCPKKQPTYSTFTKNVSTGVPKEALPQRKAALPTRKEQPKYGLVSSKNFVVANAVEVIVSADKFRKGRSSGAGSKSANQEFERYVDKPDFGKRPAYLDDVKQSIAMEKEVLQELLDEMNLSARQGTLTESMPEADREALIKQLKRKWGVLNSHYQKACGGADSNTKKKLKERYERELQQIEDDIKLISRGRLAVLMD
ncbi:Enkurin [Hondaea fermentalgiana]|uniref:Enkurin n=1 Tax=Hondaea fermentalgiana TaxID=2315210 RepID=A0A2R5G4S7_9STRA|nr:Enkurin [Hondaea fermentalgiana]|eukprot:GBG25329.1 Enkurin [Hondaea fermentalgiana]